MENKVSPFAPDLGLEDISRYNDKLPSLPTQRDAQLTGGQVRHRVDELFSKGSMDQKMKRFVSPRPSNPSVLIPSRFEALVHECAQDMRERTKNSDNPVLQRAQELLDHELKLRVLLASYRMMLMQA